MDLLKSVLKRIIQTNPTLKSGVSEAQIFELWGAAVGDAIARHTRPVQLRGRTLMVSVDHPIWKQELHSNKMMVLKKLNDHIQKTLGERPEPWIEDIFLVSPKPVIETGSKDKLKYPKKSR